MHTQTDFVYTARFVRVILAQGPRYVLGNDTTYCFALIVIIMIRIVNNNNNDNSNNSSNSRKLTVIFSAPLQV